MSKNPIVNEIKWDNIYLKFYMEADTDSDLDFCIFDCYSDRKFPVTLSSGQITVNITNVTGKYGSEMLDSSTWLLGYEENGSGTVTPVEYSRLACQKTEGLDKIFPYWNRTYSYNVKLIPGYYSDVLVFKIDISYMIRNKKPAKEYISAESSGTKEKIKKLIVHAYEAIFRCLYSFFYGIRGKKGNSILLMTESKNELSGNLKTLYEKFLDDDDMKRYKISSKSYEVFSLSSIKVAVKWAGLIWKIAKQDFIIIDDYCPFFKMIKPKEKTQLIQVWHAGVGFKSVGYSRFGKEGSPRPVRSSHRNYDKVVVGSKGLIDTYKEVFGLDEDKFEALGLPRIDEFLDQNKIKQYENYFYGKYPDFRDKTILLFAPTYRGSGQEEAYYPFDELDYKDIYEICGEDKVFLIRSHPFVKNDPEIPDKCKDRIIDMSCEDTNSMLHITDVLITDYSSVIYEFSLLDKPMIFYSFDKFEYSVKRGFHWDYESNVPGKVCNTYEELSEAIISNDHDLTKVEPFRDFGYDYLDENNCNRFIDYFFKDKKA